MLTFLDRLRRRMIRPRLSLLAAMIAVLAVGGGLGWIIARARSQAETVAEIERLGGHVRYDWPARLNRWGKGVSGLRIPGWLLRNLGPDYFTDVDAVHLNGDKPMKVDETLAAGIGRLHRLETLEFARPVSINDAGLARLSGLARLEQFTLKGDGLTDVGMSHLATLANLRALNINGDDESLGMNVTSRGLASLSGMKELRELYLVSSRIDDLGPIRGLTKLRELGMTDARLNDAGIVPLAGFPELSHLTLHGNAKLTDSGMAYLSGLGNLKYLYLSKTAVGDAGLSHLKGLTGLRHLALIETRVTDAGLASLVGFKSLDFLSLDGTRVTDAGLAHLAKMPGLKSLSLNRTAVTADGLSQLASMSRLEFLDVDETEITDADLPGLRLPVSCRYLHIEGTKATPDGIATLRARLPGVKIRD